MQQDAHPIPVYCDIRTTLVFMPIRIFLTKASSRDVTGQEKSGNFKSNILWPPCLFLIYLFLNLTIPNLTLRNDFTGLFLSKSLLFALLLLKIRDDIGASGAAERRSVMLGFVPRASLRWACLGKEKHKKWTYPPFRFSKNELQYRVLLRGNQHR